MKKWLSRLIWIPVFVIAVLFLVANRQMVALSLDPFSAVTPALTTPAFPLWLWLMAMLFIGLGAGALGVWLSARPKRSRARIEHRELKRLRVELADTAARLEAAERRTGETVPAILESADVSPQDGPQ
jgi:type VI protein secretion system component VasK